MAGDVVYRVVIDLSTRGDLPAAADSTISKMGALDGAVGRVSGSAATMASSLAKALGDVADRAISVATHLAKIGGAAAFAGATYGVVGINNELEKTQNLLGGHLRRQWPHARHG